MYPQLCRIATSLLMGIILTSSAAAQITTYIGKGGGQQVNAQDVLDITPDGRFVAYESSDSSIVPGDTNGAWDCYLYDRISDSVVRVSVGAGGAQAAGSSNFRLYRMTGRAWHSSPQLRTWYPRTRTGSPTSSCAPCWRA